MTCKLLQKDTLSLDIAQVKRRQPFKLKCWAVENLNKLNFLVCRFIKAKPLQFLKCDHLKNENRIQVSADYVNLQMSNDDLVILF